MTDETQTTIHWKCDFCGQEEGVENGVCPKCGPTQTTPISKEAKIEAGLNEEGQTVVNPPDATASEK